VLAGFFSLEPIYPLLTPLGEERRSDTRPTPLFFSTDNMLHANSMQVFYAERFVFASTSRISLVGEMVEKDPDLKHGPRGIVQ
jgi:hypothetical protein